MLRSGSAVIPLRARSSFFSRVHWKNAFGLSCWKRLAESSTTCSEEHTPISSTSFSASSRRSSPTASLAVSLVVRSTMVHASSFESGAIAERRAIAPGTALCNRKGEVADTTRKVMMMSESSVEDERSFFAQFYLRLRG